MGDRGGRIIMSMEHKAYLFDMVKYHTTIEGIIKECCFEESTLKAETYISEHWKELSSTDTCEKLDKEWKNILIKNSLQEYCDILLTACYECENDIGLGYAWDGVNECLKQLNFMDNIEKCVLGNSIEFYGKVIDPGAMGLGIVDIEEVIMIADLLQSNRKRLTQVEELQDLLYPINKQELEDAYIDLMNIYRQAVNTGKGIMFTF